MRVAFATSPQYPDGAADDREASTLLGADFVVWSDPAVDWTQYDHVVVRSTWDYTLRRDAFVDWAKSLGDRISNSAELIAFNSDKAYLGVLGVPTVPTSYVVPPAVDRLAELPELRGEVVVKPTVSAGGRDTGRFAPAHHDEARELVEQILRSGRVAMIQPYISGVDDAGESAVVFIDGEFSHGLHKKPVLREQGVAPLDDPDGESASAAVMNDPDLVTAASVDSVQRELAHDVLRQVSDRFGTPLYLRVDLVPGPHGPLVMEVEAVEPSLYLDLVPGAAQRFAEAITRRVS